MEATKFKETTILNDWSEVLSAHYGIAVGPTHVPKIATILFRGVTECLASVKDPSVPKAIEFRTVDRTFLAGAKVEYVKSEDTPDDLSAGHWEYTWTFYEDDLKGANVIDVTTNSMASVYFTSVALSQYGIQFESTSSMIAMFTLLFEMIIKWLKENTKEGQPSTLTLDGVFTATAEVEDGSIVMGLIPDGELKVLIKDDTAIQTTEA